MAVSPLVVFSDEWRGSGPTSPHAARSSPARPTRGFGAAPQVPGRRAALALLTQAAIHAPVLRLQGTANHHVLWQTAQLFACQLKAAYKTYRLILCPGGHNDSRAASASAIDGWRQQCGLNDFLQADEPPVGWASYLRPGGDTQCGALMSAQAADLGAHPTGAS